MAYYRKHCVICTAGACSNNGQSEGAKAGIGVYWPRRGSSKNLSEPISGPQTNLRADIIAATRGINQARELNYGRVTIRTDSSYVENAVKFWIPNWERSHWSKPVEDKTEFRELARSMYYIKVKIEKVSEAANLNAYRLAYEGSRKARLLPCKRKHCTIYTDGACSNNGKSEGAQAGIGVYWPQDPSNDVSEPISGRQTNQRAEIKAAIRGINQARDQGYSEVTVKIDSQYVKNAAEAWIPNWERNGWLMPVVNWAEFQELRDSMKDIKVNFEKIPSADNAADGLARAGANTTYRPAEMYPLFGCQDQPHRLS